MGEMQSKMNENLKNQQTSTQSTAPSEKSSKPAKEDYIEFEEVK